MERSRDRESKRQELHEMGSSGDGELSRWEVQEMGSA